MEERCREEGAFPLVDSCERRVLLDLEEPGLHAFVLVATKFSGFVGLEGNWSSGGCWGCVLEALDLLGLLLGFLT
jgi:hypothetical protein